MMGRTDKHNWSFKDMDFSSVDEKIHKVIKVSNRNC